MKGGRAEEERILGYLNQHPLFQEIPAAAVERLVAYTELKELRRRQVIYLPGDPGEAVFFVHDGHVKISRVTRDGKELTLAYRGPGSLFGELCLGVGGAREEMAEAMDTVLLSELQRPELEKIAQEEALIGYRLTQIVARRQRELEAKLEQLVFKDVNAKLAEVLLWLGAEFGTDDRRGTLVALKITHQELANLIGVTRETVSLTLSQFKSKGLIHMEGRRVILADRAGLRALG